jgi:hypothetical protein
MLGLVAAAVTAFAALPATAAGAAPGQNVGYSVFTDLHGWGGQQWDGDLAVARTPYQERVQALDFISGGAGELCVEAHLAGFGWQNERCGDGTLLQVGAIGLGYDIDGLAFRSAAGYVCAKIQAITEDGSIVWTDPACTTTARTAVSWPGGRLTGVAMWYQ